MPVVSNVQSGVVVHVTTKAQRTPRITKTEPLCRQTFCPQFLACSWAKFKVRHAPYLQDRAVCLILVGPEDFGISSKFFPSYALSVSSAMPPSVEVVLSVCVVPVHCSVRLRDCRETPVFVSVLSCDASVASVHPSIAIIIRYVGSA